MGIDCVMIMTRRNWRPGTRSWKQLANQWHQEDILMVVVELRENTWGFRISNPRYKEPEKSMEEWMELWRYWPCSRAFAWSTLSGSGKIDIQEYSCFSTQQCIHSLRPDSLWGNALIFFKSTLVDKIWLNWRKYQENVNYSKLTLLFVS